MMNSKLLHHHRLLLFYGDISALVLFAQQTNGGVIFPSVLPKLSIAMEPKEMIAGKVTPRLSSRYGGLRIQCGTT